MIPGFARELVSVLPEVQIATQAIPYSEGESAARWKSQ
jgi:hypothetical protein